MKNKEIYVFPEFSSQNPYLENFYEPFIADGWLVCSWRFRNIFARGILHVHWPEGWNWGASTRKKFVSITAILLLFFVGKFLPIKVVHTVHNLKPHDSFHHNLYARILYNLFLRCGHLFIHLSHAGKEIFINTHSFANRRQHCIATHPSYSKQVSFRKTKKTVDDVIIISMVGTIHRYKMPERLIDVFKSAKLASNYILKISGNVSDDYYSELKNLTAGVSNIQISQSLLNDKAYEASVKEADLIVLPYGSIFNSGAAIYALSCGVPVLAPNTPVMTELQNTFGKGVHMFDQNTFADDFIALMKTRTFQEVNISGLDTLYPESEQRTVLAAFEDQI